MDAAVATRGCFSATHDSACIRSFVDRLSRGERGTTTRMLIARSVLRRPDGGVVKVSLVTFGVLGGRDPAVLGGVCEMRPL